MDWKNEWWKFVTGGGLVASLYAAARLVFYWKRGSFKLETEARHESIDEWKMTAHAAWETTRSRDAYYAKKLAAYDDKIAAIEDEHRTDMALVQKEMNQCNADRLRLQEQNMRQQVMIDRLKQDIVNLTGTIQEVASESSSGTKAGGT